MTYLIIALPFLIIFGLLLAVRWVLVNTDDYDLGMPGPEDVQDSRHNNYWEAVERESPGKIRLISGERWE